MKEKDDEIKKLKREQVIMLKLHLVDGMMAGK